MSIKLENISYQYRDSSRRKALSNVSLEIKPGEFIGIVGHTGSGKSTLIQHLNGLLKPDEGKVLFDGSDIYQEGYSLKELRGKVGLSFQYPEHQLFEVTVFEDVCFGPKNLGLSQEEVKGRAREALQMVGMDEKYYEKSPFELSGGQKRRVAIAGILAMHPQYFILDEPTAGLDPIGRDKILELLKRLHENQGITIILVSHSMEEIANYVDRILVMDQGCLLYDDVPKEVFKHKEKLEEIGLAVPFYMYLMEDLRERGFFEEEVTAITLKEAEDQILKVLKRKQTL
ncbi:MAG: energy-coupling factor transporter ATPase [Candidatus Fimousia sp.]|uniref:energy-coupling factor transporter ATPase n=1 Tax=Anaerostipes sp. 992a TaxID=1261637 RepID=UPI000952B120|nr:energy-coupling factor transporter ATPase [Anaerostipes sp. 992a]OLR62968.1 energy-coupling factor transporter ATPase [Anaerostipes sp. 992a]